MRKKLENRRRNVTLKFEMNTQTYLLTAGFYYDGGIGEIFINTSMRAGSESDVNASDAAVAVSLALQYGCPLEELRQSLKRNPDGSPTGPLGKALDEVTNLLRE